MLRFVIAFISVQFRSAFYRRNIRNLVKNCEETTAHVGVKLVTRLTVTSSQ